MKIGRAMAAVAIAAAILSWDRSSTFAQEAGHGEKDVHHGHEGHATKVDSPAAEAKTVEVWVCAGDDLTGLSWEAPCPLDGKPAVKKTVERTAFTDLKNPKCPIMGGDTDPTLFALYKGKAVRFCCAGCGEPFFKDPAGYIAELEKGDAPKKPAGHEGRPEGHHGKHH